MYGLLLLNLEQYVVKAFGQQKWDEVKTALKVKDVSRNAHSSRLIAGKPQAPMFLQKSFPPEDNFPESQLIKMGKKAIQLLGVKDEEFYEGMGTYFVEMTNKY